uniref:Uncharacterized protein n=1 Tax=Nothobranchius kadleci TaxID=1051664 RepID=A0A1A8CBQ7_NOTKA
MEILQQIWSVLITRLEEKMHARETQAGRWCARARCMAWFHGATDAEMPNFLACTQLCHDSAAGWIRPCTAPIHAATDTEGCKDELHPKIFFHLLFLKCHQ